MQRFFATSPRGVEDLLAAELETTGAREVTPGRGGVAFAGELATAYRACLWSRVASRVLAPIGETAAATPEELYAGARAIDWREHLGPDATLAVDFTSSRSSITHTQFGALKVKDAIVDRLRDDTGARPSIELERPSVRVNVHVEHDRATLSIDLAGEALHKRGYRDESVRAPLKENLAAAILLRARWPAAAREGKPLLDPMCGSGTLLIEAALMAGDVSPQLGRTYFGFLGWRGHDAAAWAALLTEAAARREAGLAGLPRIVGFDRDRRAVAAALQNLQHAGLDKHVHVERRELADAAPETLPPGLLVTNPPYGVRLAADGSLAEDDDVRDVAALYERLADLLKQRFAGWTACVLTAQGELASHLRLKSLRRHSLMNGPIPCWLHTFTISARPRGDDATPSPPRAPRPVPQALEPFVNRLEKNKKRLGKWAAREGVTCYRLYDADLPEYAVAIDLYEQWAHVQEYAPPASIDPRKAQERLRELVQVLPDALELPRSHVFLKVRERQRGARQYEKRATRGALHEVHEGGHTFLVDFETYLDTGLFLDHRKTRSLIGELARGKRFLNLFAYTCSATVYAAKGGATASVSVDASRTYLAWGEKNLAANGLDARRHVTVQADVTRWLDEEARGGYGLIFIDPPTFSNSKDRERSFDVQRDHVALLERAGELLTKDGVIVFSNNYRRFRLDEGLTGFTIEDITAQTLPEDFARNARIHRCWTLRPRRHDTSA